MSAESNLLVRGKKAAIVLITISIAPPLRFANDLVDVTSNGDVFKASPMQIVWPQDSDTSAPRTTITLPQTDSLMATLRATKGLNRAPVTIQQVFRDELNTNFQEIFLNIINVAPSTDGEFVQITMAFQDLFKKRLTSMYFDRQNSIALF